MDAVEGGERSQTPNLSPAIRQAVLWRETSNGTQTPEGESKARRLMFRAARTRVATLQQRTCL